MQESLRLRTERALARVARPLLRRIGYAVVWRNPRGHSLPTHLAALFSHLGINCVLDVGAHWGEYGRALRRHGYRGRIVSFEPVRANVARLEAERRGDPDWQVRSAALGSVRGSTTINVAHDTSLSSFLTAAAPLNEKVGTAIAVGGHEEVEVLTLDDVVPDATAGIAAPRVFLKLDTQGWDLEVLRGGAQTVPSMLGLQLEVAVLPLYEGMPRYADAIAEVEALGFELTGVYPVAYDGLRVVELDCVFMQARA